jgi:hypothetical protein
LNDFCCLPIDQSPLFSTRWSDAEAFGSERNEHHEDYPAVVAANSIQAARLRRDDNRAFKEHFVQIDKSIP